MKAQALPRLSRSDEVRRVLDSSKKMRDELLERYPDLLPGSPWSQLTPTGYRYPSSRQKRALVFDWFFFKRFRFPARLALEREKGGNLKAHEQLTRARNEFWRLTHGYPSVPRFKVDEIHSDLLELGLPLGLQKLSSEELAACFESVCPCGKLHDADALKKQRSRVLKDLEAARRQTIGHDLRKPSCERYAALGADRYVAVAYRFAGEAPCVEISRKGKGLEYVVEKDNQS